MDFVFWTVGRVPQACHLDEVTNLEEAYRLHDGLPLADGFPSDVTFQMKEDFPDDTLLTDTLINVNSVLIISEKTKEALTELGVKDVEYLPVVIKDHRGKASKTQYYVLNPLVWAPLLKFQECEPTMNDLIPDMAESLSAFVVDPEAAAKAPLVFHIQHIPEYVGIRTSLARELDARGLVNNRWIRPDAIASGRVFTSLDHMHKKATATL
jgi:hypothetical protein